MVYFLGRAPDCEIKCMLGAIIGEQEIKVLQVVYQNSYRVACDLCVIVCVVNIAWLGVFVCVGELLNESTVICVAV